MPSHTTTTTTTTTRNMKFYCKIAYTSISGLFEVPSNLNIGEFLEYANTNFRNILNINSRYYIEMVEIITSLDGPAELAPPMEPRYDETLEERYGNNYNSNKTIGFYIRPTHPITRVFVCQDDYSI